MNSYPKTKCRGPYSKGARGFTLIELLAVIAIMVVLLTLAGPAFNLIRGASDTTRSVYGISETLEQARTFAVANNTYVWVGLLEEDASSPGRQGIGRVILSVVASKDGSNQLALTGSLTPSNAIQVSNLIKNENIHINNLSSLLSGGNLAKRPCATRIISLSQQAAAQFAYPLGSNSSFYRFQTMVQFSPVGDSALPPDSPVPWTEIGLQPTHGNFADSRNLNLSAIQIAGIGGQVQVYRQ